MFATMSAADYRKTVAGKPKVAKYRNRRTEYAGRTYDSALEARRAFALDVMKRAGEIAGWIPQFSIPVPGTGKRMVVDFMVIGLDGVATFEDTKGPEPTRDWLLKRELVENAYGIKIEIVRSV